MPCFNDGEYIRESINSALNQTYKNIELIIIDDGSTDIKTINILNSIRDKRIKVLKTKRLGPSGARNEGIRNSNGKYILPLDSDDLIDKTYIEKAVNIMEEREDVGIVYCKAELFGEINGPWELPKYDIKNMLVDNVIFVTSIFRKADWELVGGFDTDYIYGLEDYDFWLSILELNKEVVQIQEVLFKYRIKQQSRNKSFEDNEENVKLTYEKLYRKHTRLYNKYYDEYIILLRNQLISERYKYRKIVNKFKKNPIIRILSKNRNIILKLKKILLD